MADSTTSLTARVDYLDPSAPPVVELHRNVNGQDDLDRLPTASVKIVAENARRRVISLDTEGAELVSSPIHDAIDYCDRDAVVEEYYPRCEALLRRHLGKEVTIRAFDHNVRVAGGGHGNHQGVLAPIAAVHGDYTRVSAPRRLALLAQPPSANDVLRERLDGDALLDPRLVQECLDGRRRYAFINIWRSTDTDHTVESYPLGWIASPSVNLSTLRTLQIHYIDRIGENYWATPDNQHQWLYFADMDHSEALLLKQWDSAGDVACGAEIDTTTSTMALHAALHHHAPPSARPRQSIEVRCVCWWPLND